MVHNASGTMSADTMDYPSILIVEPSQSAAIALVETGNLAYAAFASPLPIIEDPVGIIYCKVVKLGDVLLSLHIRCNSLKAVDFSVFGVSLHSKYFMVPFSGVYEVNVPVSLLNVPNDEIVLMVASGPGVHMGIQDVVATYVMTRPEERGARLGMFPDGDRFMNMLDVALYNGCVVAEGFFDQDGEMGMDDADSDQFS